MIPPKKISNGFYNNASGALFFDADGVGGAAQVRLAQLVGNPALTNASFAIF